MCFFFFLFIEPSNVIEVEGKGIKKWTVPKAFGMKTRHEEYLSSALIPTSLANGNGSVQKSINIKKKKRKENLLGRGPHILLLIFPNCLEIGMGPTKEVSSLLLNEKSFKVC